MSVKPDWKQSRLSAPCFWLDGLDYHRSELIMHKSFVLVGFMAAVLISQGCGGKKEVANLSPDLPTPVAARPTTISLDNASSGNISSPSMGKGEEEGSSEDSSQNSGGAPAGSPGGPPREIGRAHV